MEYFVRLANVNDLAVPHAFTLAEVRAAENKQLATACVQAGVCTGVVDPQRAHGWVLIDAKNNPLGSISVVREWSEWQADGGHAQ